MNVEIIIKFCYLSTTQVYWRLMIPYLQHQRFSSERVIQPDRCWGNSCLPSKQDVFGKHGKLEADRFNFKV